jgi:iron complex outermembrane recepter protein
MQSGMFRTLVFCALIAGSALGLVSSPAGAQTATFSFSIPRQPLAKTLRDYGEATGQQIIFTATIVADRQAPALHGTFGADEALRLILKGSGLAAQRTPAGAIMILPAGGAANATAPAADAELEEIVVTATKREESLRKISGSVSAFNAAGLDAVGAQSLGDYLTRTPGVVFNESTPGNSTAIIRGVATTTGIAQAQGTTGYFINDVPLTEPFYSGGIPDIDTFDVDNVSILRGPQGTLFGSASLGGAINYQAAKPNLDQFDAHFRTSIESTQHGDLSYGGKAMVNVPIVSDVFAIRGVFDYRRDGGYIDNVGIGRSDSNRTDIVGGRVLATWIPAAGTKINYLFLEQTQNTADVGFILPSVGPYAKRTALAEPSEYRTTVHNLRLDQDLPFATFTATVARHEKRFAATEDFSNLLPPSLGPAEFFEPGSTRGNTVEARLASLPGTRLEYLVGVFHDSTDELITDYLVAPNAAAALGTPVLLVAPVRITGKESAVFGEGTWHFSDAWKITLGGRYFDTRLWTDTASSGPLVGAATDVAGKSSQRGFSPKASLTWSPAEDFLYYALVSKGFRFGGPNISAASSAGIPASFKSDSLINYEIGARTSFLEHRLLLDGTIYDIEWSDIQASLLNSSGFAYTTNAGKARNYGFEGTATFRPMQKLTLLANLTYLDAKLRSDFTSGSDVLPAGTTLPGASKWQISDSAVYTFSNIGISPTVALSHRYISTAPGALVADPERQGGYNLFDARASISVNRFGISMFVENVGNAHGISQALADNRGFTEYVVRPRTYGLTLDYKMKAPAGAGF